MHPSGEIALKNEIVNISRRCASQGWCPITLGNISALNLRRDKVYITATGTDMNRLELQDVLTLDLDGNVLDGDGNPSIEANFHLGVYGVRTDVWVVLHVHPPFATAYATAEKTIPMVTDVAELLIGDVPLLPYAPPGSIELAAKVVECFQNPTVKAALLRRHGIVSVGETLEKAYSIAAWVEETAKIALLSALIKSQ